jgi:hypothetical protein
MQLSSDGSAPATASLLLPIRLETMDEIAERTALAADLAVKYPGLTVDDVPYVKVGDIEVSIEWSVKNMSNMEGTFKLQLNGANFLWAYDPTMVPVGEDEPPPPGLDGDIPLHIAANASMSGLFKEDQVREASIDLDQITRANINPFRATLLVNKHDKSFSQLAPLMYDMNGDPLPQAGTGIVYPREAFAQMIRFDIVFTPDRPMVLDFAVRVRDVRGILHEMLDAAFDGGMLEAELQYPSTFMPMVFIPAAPPP